jgi:hypothetical protein
MGAGNHETRINPRLGAVCRVPKLDNVVRYQFLRVFRLHFGGLKVAAWEALQALVALLKSSPLNIVAPDHIGLRRPSSAGDLPRIAVSANEVQHFLAGIGGVVGSRRVSNTAWATETGSGTSGFLTIELWADDEAILTNLASAVFERLEDPVITGGAGFGRVAARSVEVHLDADELSDERIRRWPERGDLAAGRHCRRRAAAGRPRFHAGRRRRRRQPEPTSSCSGQSGRPPAPAVA